MKVLAPFLKIIDYYAGSHSTLFVFMRLKFTKFLSHCIESRLDIWTSMMKCFVWYVVIILHIFNACAICLNYGQLTHNILNCLSITPPTLNNLFLFLIHVYHF